VIRVFIDHDRVAVPKPVIHVVKLERGNGEIKSVEPEAPRASSREVKLMAAAESAGEASVLPRMLNMQAWIVAAHVMADPVVIGVNVGSFRMPGPVGKSAAFRSRLRRPFRLRGVWLRSRLSGGRRAMRRDVPAANVMGPRRRGGSLLTPLRKRRGQTQRQYREESDRLFHFTLQWWECNPTAKRLQLVRSNRSRWHNECFSKSRLTEMKEGLTCAIIL
jgi:hypothetical protein